MDYIKAAIAKKAALDLEAAAEKAEAEAGKRDFDLKIGPIRDMLYGKMDDLCRQDSRFSMPLDTKGERSLIFTSKKNIRQTAFTCSEPRPSSLGLTLYIALFSKILPIGDLRLNVYAGDAKLVDAFIIDHVARLID